MNEETKKYAEEIKRNMLRVCNSILNTDISHFYKWEADGVTIKPSDTLTPEELLAVKEVKCETIDYVGKNPRTVTKRTIELHDKCSILNTMSKLLEEIG